MHSLHPRNTDRFHLTHHVLARLRDRAYFSADQVAGAVYHGAGGVHPQQKKRVRELLDRYVLAGILERHDTVARCRLYRHTGAGAEQVDADAVFEFEVHAARRWSLQDKLCMAVLDQDLDRLIPRDADPACFTAQGKLLPRPWPDVPCAGWGRPVHDGPPSALAYARVCATTGQPQV